MSRILVNELGARTGTEIVIKSGSTLGGADSQLKITGGSSGQVLTTNGLGVLTWSTIASLPSQSGQLGKFLTTDGNAASWGSVDAFPTQTSNTGKFLTTDGTTVSWATVAQYTLPAQTSQAGKFLTTDGTNESWSTIVHPEELPSQSGQADKFLKSNGTTATWETVSGAEISELNNFFKNWNVIDTTITTTVAATENAAIIGPLGINTTGKWNIDGKVTIM
tara:strand:+ start:422 stop:1084 length:663 start_codon:yes stop_codon:yes gene_type:complete